MDELPAIVRLPVRLLLALLKFGGRLVLGLLLLVVGMFGIAILAAYPQLPPHEQTCVLWGFGMLLAVILVGSMAWLWIVLQHTASTGRSRRNSYGYPPLETPAAADDPVNTLIRNIMSRR